MDNRTETGDGPGLSTPARILLLRFSALGDVLLTFPAVLALRERYPDAHIAYLTDARLAELLAGLPAIDRVLTVDRMALRRLSARSVARLAPRLLAPLWRRWDAVIDLQGFGETAWLTRWTCAPIRVGRRGRRRQAWAYRPFVDEPLPQCYMTAAHIDTLVRARLLPGSATVPARGYFGVSNGMAEEWRRRTFRLGPRPDQQIGLFVSAARGDKRWPAERFGELARELCRDTRPGERRVLVFAGPDDAAIVRRVVAAADPDRTGRAIDGGSGSIGALAAAWKSCDLVVSNDTGPMHLSVAVGTPTVAIFPRRLAHFVPPPPHRALFAPADGIAAVAVSEVLAAARELLATQRAASISS